jgi:hypothetical protein
MHAGRRPRVALGEQRVCARGAELAVRLLPALAHTRRGRGREPELRERGAQVETRATDHERPPADGQCGVDRLVGQPLVAPGGDGL